MSDIVMVVKLVKVVEDDVKVVVGSFVGLFLLFQFVLFEVMGSLVDYMKCYSEVVGLFQDVFIDVVVKGQRFINVCL